MVGKVKSSSKASEEAPPERKLRGRPPSPSRRSPARTKSPGRRKSPARTKSPARRASPSNVVKAKSSSPSRKSPSRQTTSKTEERPVRSTRKQLIIDSDEDSDDVIEVKEVKEKPKATVRGRTRKLEIELEPLSIARVTEELPSYGAVKRTTRSSTREVERVVHLKNFDAIGKKLGEFSDEDEITEIKLKADKLELSEAKKQTEYAGIAGTALLVPIIPLFVIALNLVCDQTQCTFQTLPNLLKYKSLTVWFDLKASLIYLAYLIGLVVLTALPFGGRRVNGLLNKQGKLEYNTNGLFAFVVLSAILGGLHFRNIPTFAYILDHSLHFLTAALITGLLLSVYAYVRSFYVPISGLNLTAVGRNHLYSYYLGREISPRLFGIIDLKLLTNRLACIGALLINTAYLLKSLGLLNKATPTSANNVPVEGIKGLNLDPTVLTYYTLSLIYLLDSIVTERISISSYKIHNEGFGFNRSVGSALYPFLYAPIIRHIVERGTKLNNWLLGLVTIVFLVGYLLYRLSNNQKNLFKNNPYCPAVAHYDTIPTAQGNKLLASGFWGVVRHPNYLGDILINVSFGLFAHCVPPVLAAVAVALVLVYRAVKDNARCRIKYGSAWERYSSKVRHVLIPKIY